MARGGRRRERGDGGLSVMGFGAEIPFVSHLGFTLHRMEGGESELHYTARPEHLNSLEVTHGGATMTLLDVTMAVAARTSRAWNIPPSA